MRESGSIDKPIKVEVVGKPIVVEHATLTPRIQVERRKVIGEPGGGTGGRFSVNVVPLDVAVEQGDTTYEVATPAADESPLRALAAISLVVMVACWLVIGFTRLRIRPGNR